MTQSNINIKCTVAVDCSGFTECNVVNDHAYKHWQVKPQSHSEQKYLELKEVYHIPKYIVFPTKKGYAILSSLWHTIDILGTILFYIFIFIVYIFLFFKKQ